MKYFLRIYFNVSYTKYKVAQTKLDVHIIALILHQSHWKGNFVSECFYNQALMHMNI